MAAGRRCIILGGTGHLGNAFLRALLQGGHEADVACRRGGARANLQGLKAGLLVGDDRAPGLLEAWVRGHDLVIDAAAPYPLRLVDRMGSPHRQVQAALARCRRLLDAVRDADAELIHVSSFTTLDRPLPWHARLQSIAVQGSHPYFETKAAIERAVLQAAARGLRAVVVNPSVCIGPYDLKPREAAFVAVVARGDLLGVTGQPLNVIDVRDVADLALAAQAQKIYGRPIALSGHDTDLASLVREICRLAGRQPPLIRGSTRLAAAGAWWTELMASALGQAERFPSLPFLLLAECRATAPSPLQRALGLTPRPLDVTLGDALRWYRSLGYC